MGGYGPWTWSWIDMDRSGHRYMHPWSSSSISSFFDQKCDSHFYKNVIDFCRSQKMTKMIKNVKHTNMYITCTGAGPRIWHTYIHNMQTCRSIHVTFLIKNGTPFLSKNGHMIMIDTCYIHTWYIPWAVRGYPFSSKCIILMKTADPAKPTPKTRFLRFWG